MNAKELLGTLIDRLKDLKSQGRTVAVIDPLLVLLADVEKAFTGGTLPMRAEELIKIQASFDLEHYRATVEGQHRLFESVLSTVSAAMKSLFLINGGGCVALLALIGQLAQKPALAENIGILSGPLLSFAVGVGAAAFAACLLALAQKAFHEKHPEWGRAFGYFTMALGWISLAAFGTGCYTAFCQLSQLRFIVPVPA